MPEQPLSVWRQLGYACGMLGWSIMINIIAVMLIYFYIPPSNSGMAQLIPQATVFGIFTLLSLIAASGRLLDAVTDPLIANWSDRFHHSRGRRIPFMKVGVLPSVVFGILVFLPLEFLESYRNVWWLTVIQAFFYLSVTIYIIPYNALLPELAPGSAAKVRLSTWLSLAFVLGIILSSQTPAIADLVQGLFKLTNRHVAFQLAIGSLYLLGGVFMAVPLFAIDEQRDCYGEPATVPFIAAFRHILAHRNFLVFIAADFSYFVSLTIISSGMLYFVKVLLFLNEGIGGAVMGVMVLFSLLFYPLVVRLSARVEKRKLMIWSLLSLGIALMGLFFLGKGPLPPRVQIFGFALIVAVPTAFLGILPYALIAEIAEQDGADTGQQKEAMFFAVRNFSTKLGQTIGIMAFTILTLLGKDPYDDLGIRLAAVFGGTLCILAGLIFTRFEEP
ncbi:MAG: MFS transporter [Phaeodactylibacter sp.]|nr:MFS transporter [Phaeodactylibacter sp.]